MTKGYTTGKYQYKVIAKGLGKGTKSARKDLTRLTLSGCVDKPRAGTRKGTGMWVDDAETRGDESLTRRRSPYEWQGKSVAERQCVVHKSGGTAGTIAR